MNARSRTIVIAAVWMLAATIWAAPANAIDLDAWCMARGTPLHRDMKTDDSRCVAAAATAAAISNQPLHYGAGNPVVLGGAAQVVLDSVRMYGDTWQDKSGTGQRGSTFWIVDQQHSPFLIGNGGANIEGVSFFYPDQSSSNAEPFAYPALFAPTAVGAGVQALDMQRVFIENAYVGFDFRGTIIGGVSITNSRMFGILAMFRLSVTPEVIFLANDLFSYGADNMVGGEPLATWHNNNGTFVEVSGDGDGTHASSTVASLFVVNSYVYGPRFGVHVLGSGRFWGQFVGGGIEAQTIFQADPGAYVQTTLFAHQYWNAVNIATGKGDACGAVCDLSLYSDMSFDDISATANGTAFHEEPGPWSGVRIRESKVEFGNDAVPGANYSFLLVGPKAASTSSVDALGNHIAADYSGNAVTTGIVTGPASSLVLGNRFGGMSQTVRCPTPCQAVILGNTP